MKKTLFSFATMLMLTTPVVAQRVVVDNFDQLKIHYSTPEISVVQNEYLLLDADGYITSGEVGAPALPVMNSLLTVPVCDDMSLTVENAVYDTLALPVGRLFPLQAPRSKSDRSTPQVVINETLYSTDALFGLPLVSVEYLGTGRDRNYAILRWSPVQVNPVSGTMVVCRNADVTLRYVGSDAAATLKQYDRYHTPAFSLGSTLNTLFTNAKDVRSSAPVRMVVVAPQSLQCSALDDFVKWKRTQGMLVNLIYVESGSTASVIAEQLQPMYDDATDEAPAPTYLLLVGDNNIMPAFDSRMSGTYGMNDHITDLYYVTWAGNDKLPECYQGRFSARDTTTLRAIIEKTLYYERYRFLDDSYLGRAALIAGVDQSYYSDTNDNAYTCADPTMDYIAYFYVNANHGFSQVNYYKNNTSYAPEGVTVTGSSRSGATAAALRSFYNGGVGLVNYSAHGDWDQWYMPSFNVTHVNAMTNNDKPSFMIGNCCLSNKFDKSICFGEALLRKGNKAGAVGYIGATNSTYWNEDFYWSVGVRNNIRNRMTPQYNYQHMGTYDRLFHTHGELRDDLAVTAGRMVVAGNMAVQSSSSSSSSWYGDFASYYWEIYELMGDPSLMPWMGLAAELTVTGVDYGTVLQLTTVPYAYVAIVRDDDLTLVSAAYADETGMVDFPVVGVSLADCFVSVTAQGYKPYVRSCNAMNLGVDNPSSTSNLLAISPNPATGRCSVSAHGLRRVTVLNMMGQTLLNVNASVDSISLDVSALPAGLYLLRAETAEGASTCRLVVN